MLKKLTGSLILSLVALMAILFPCNLDISASSDNSHKACVDYNMDQISQFLPANMTGVLQNYVADVNHGEFVTVSSFTQTLNCYYKCSWTVGGEVIDLSSYPITKDVTIVATWTPVEYTIHYNYLSGEEDEITNLEMTKKYTIEDGRIDFYRPERSNYIFVDWYTSSSLADQFLSIYKTEYAIGDIYLYAKWKPIEYKINYHTDAYNVYNPPTYNVEHPGFDLASAKKTGYIFEGWYLDKEFTNKCVRIDQSFSGEINLYPKWTAEVYTVTYILPDGSKSNVDVAYGETCELPKLNKSIFEIVKTDVSRKNITGDTTINVRYVNIWYVYLLGLLLISGIITLIIYLIIRKQKSIHKLRYIYSNANKRNKRWR